MEGRVGRGEGLREVGRGQIFQAGDKDSPKVKVREKALEV